MCDGGFLLVKLWLFREPDKVEMQSLQLEALGIQTKVLASPYLCDLWPHLFFFFNERSPLALWF